METEKLQRFRATLLEQRHRYLEKTSSEEEATAFTSSQDDLKDQLDLSRHDLNKQIAFHLSERERQMIEDINKALEKIEDGDYGLCARCEQPIVEKRLEIIPTALHCAPCQSAIESNGHYEDEG